MKKIVKSALLAGLAFFAISYFYPGFSFDNVQVLIIASAFFGLVNLTVKPFLKFLSLPLNLLSFGLFSFLTGVIIIFIVDYFVEGFSVLSFDFAGLDVSGFKIPAVFLIPPLSALVGSIFISWLNTLLRWVFN